MFAGRLGTQAKRQSARLTILLSMKLPILPEERSTITYFRDNYHREECVDTMMYLNKEEMHDDFTRDPIRRSIDDGSSYQYI